MTHLHFLCEQKTKQKSRPLQAACVLRYAIEAGRKAFSLIPYQQQDSAQLNKGISDYKSTIRLVTFGRG